MAENEGAFCTHCGAGLEKGSAFCPECGNPVEGADNMYRSGPGSSEYVYGLQNAEKARSEKRLRLIYVLFAGYIFLSISLAVVSMSFGALLDSFASDPSFIETLTSFGMTIDEAYAQVESMFTLGVAFAASAILITVSFILSILKRKHIFAVLFCVAGSVITPVAGADGILFLLIGLMVAYILYRSKSAFKD